MKGFGWYRSKKLTNLSDLEVVSLFIERNDQEMIGELFKRYHHLVFGVCLKYLRNAEEAKDATIDIFELLPNKLQKQSIINFSAWLHTSTKNHCLMQLRSAPVSSYSIEDVHELQAQEIHVEEELTNHEADLERLEKALHDLVPGQRRCIELFYLDRKSYKQISEETGLDTKQVKSHIQNAKRNLKIILSENYEKEAQPHDPGE